MKNSNKNGRKQGMVQGMAGMVRVVAWTKKKGPFYDYVKLSRIQELFGKGYVIAFAD